MEVELWIRENIPMEFRDYELERIYKVINHFRPSLCEEMMNEKSYGKLLKNINRLDLYLISFDTITDYLKDNILVNGSCEHCLDDYMDWDGFTQAEIDECYEEYDGLYIQYDYLYELYETISKIIRG